MLVEYRGENSGGIIFAKTEHISVQGMFRDERSGELMSGELTIEESNGEIVCYLALWASYSNAGGTVKVAGIIERTPSGATENE